MKRFVPLFSLGAVLALCMTCPADSPVYKGPTLDYAPAVAYNSVNREFLVVWSEFMWVPPFFGPVMGQRYRESGVKIGGPFQIFETGVRPSLAYNPDMNEYFVVVESYLSINFRLLRSDGSLIYAEAGISPAIFPSVRYNSISKSYVFIGIVWSNPDPYDPDTCERRLVAGQLAHGAGWGWYNWGIVIHTLSDTPCAVPEGIAYAFDFAPIVSTKTPKGRYVIALEGPAYLKMLDHTGTPVVTLYNPQSGATYDSIPFQQSKVGEVHNIDVAFGYWHGDPVFFLVWGDTDQYVSGAKWSGIWGGIVDAVQDTYYTTSGVSNEVFPISYQWTHWDYGTYPDSWRPRVAYNASDGSFAVVWRETPGTDPRDLTNVNHIRGNTIVSYQIPPPANFLLSSPMASADPTTPALASSTLSPNNFVAWEDHRNVPTSDWDIYGTLLNAADRTLEDLSGLTMPWLLLLWEKK